MAIPVDSLNTQQNIKLATVDTPNYNSLTQDYTSPYISAQNDLTKAESTLTKDQSSIQNLNDIIAGKEGYQAQQAKELGLNQANQDYLAKVAELSSLNKQASVAQQQEISTGRQLGSTQRFVAGQQAEIERNRAIQALSIGAEADIIKGRIDIAKDKVQQAVDLKYKDTENLLKAKVQQYEMNKDMYNLLSAKEKTLFDRQQNAAQLELKKMEQKKKDEAELDNLILEAITSAPADIIASAKRIKEQGGSKLDVAQALGKYGGDYLKTELLKQQIETEKAQRAKYYTDIDKIKSEMVTKGLPATTANVAKVEASQNVYNLANELKTLQGKGGAVGAGIGKFFGVDEGFAGTDRATYEAKFKQLKDTLAASNLDKLKGAMSDKDIEFLRNIGTSLSLSMPEEAFDKELDRVAETMSRVPGVQITVKKEIPSKYKQAGYVSKQPFEGTSIINKIDESGNINFSLPTTR